MKSIIEEVGRNAYKIAGIFDETWYKKIMNELSKDIEIYKLPQDEQERWDKELGQMLREWAEELQSKGLPAKKALKMFKEELNRQNVRFDACPY